MVAMAGLWMVYSVVVLTVAVLRLDRATREAWRACGALCRREAMRAAEEDDGGAERGAEARYRAIDAVARAREGASE